jgi:hypothetical protein
MSVKLYNKLADTLKKETSEYKFMHTLKKVLVKNSYYSLQEFFEDTQEK